MQALLSYDQSPPIAAPFRFFLTAPVFGILAGLLVMHAGPNAFMSRWTPEALALTHLITVGFMLQVMLGALIQILPVVAGANIVRPSLIACVVHCAITVGALLLAAAFLTFAPWMFVGSSLLLFSGGAVFLGASGWAMRGVPATGPTISGLKTAISGLAVTVALGVAMAFGMSGWFDLPLMQLADIHLGWGLLVWGIGLLAAVAYVVVPMFQITPAYPEWFVRRFVPSLLVVASAWTIAVFGGWDIPLLVAALALIGMFGLFAGVTLFLQRRSKRASFDTNQHCWRGAMLSLLSGGGVWLVARSVPEIGEWPGLPILCGVLVMYGGFVSVITGMLYKIVPFLTWLHLQNFGQGVLMAPNMKKIIAERTMHRQMLSHFFAGILLVLAVFWPETMAMPAGAAVVVSQAWLAMNLCSAVRVFRRHRRLIAEKRANT